MSMGEGFQKLSDAFVLNFIKEERYLLMLDGLKLTIFVSIFAILLGVFMGSLAYFLRRSRFKLLRSVGYVYVDIIRGTPTVTQLLIIYFVVFGSVKNMSGTIAAIIAFGFNSGAYVSEIIRAGIQSIDKGQTEAGRSLGLSSRQTMFFIVVPQAIKNILPALINEFIVLIKETAIMGYIGLQDLTKAGDIIRSVTFDPYMPLLAPALVYYIIIKCLTLIMARVERKLRSADAH